MATSLINMEHLIRDKGGTNWDLCFICQEEINEKLRSTPQGLETLSEMLLKFSEINALNFNINRLLNKDADLHSVLKESHAKYHHTCYAKYNARAFQRAVTRNKTKNTVETSQPGCSRRSVSEASTHTLGELLCCFCSKVDAYENLVAAGTFHATGNKADSSHVQNISEKWKIMAVATNNNELLQKLTFGDVTSNELFYHQACYRTFKNQYRGKQREIDRSTIEKNVEWKKASAMSKIISYIYETEDEVPGSVFDATCLEAMYIELLKCHNIQVVSHITRFTDKLVAQIEYLEKRTIGRKVSLYFKAAFDTVLLDKAIEPDIFMRSIRHVVQPIRNAMSLTENSFQGTFAEDSQIDSVPIQLLTLVSMLIDGTNFANKGFSQPALSASQIIMYNFRKHGTETGSQRRHLKQRETPIVIYNSLKLYATVRSRVLIDHFFSLGICVSYQRVLDITKSLYNSTKKQFEEDGVLVPQVLRKGIFSVMAKDNIDLNATSTMITSHYHGTSLSVFQFPAEGKLGICRDNSYNDDTHLSKKLEGLPREYTNVCPLPRSGMGSEIYAPLCTMNLPSYFETLSSLELSLNLEFEWLECVSNSFILGKCDSWSKHHASLKRRKTGIPGINAIMPMINKPVHTIETQYHIMSINKKTTNFLNVSQTPIDVSDQPVYALTRTIQWKYPGEFGLGHYFSFLGGLHIEQQCLVLHGELINGSGIKEILSTTDLSIIGTSVAVDVNDIKRARYCLQVVTSAIYMKLKDAYKKSTSPLSLMKWLEERALTSQMCFYWKLILDFQVLVLTYIRATREGNFQVYIESFKSIVKWYFALDHYNYARWGTVHCFDLMFLEKTCPDLHEEFQSGNFSFLKTNSEYSRIALDQVHEQNNKVIKGSGGSKHLLNRTDESGLIRWESVGTDIASIICKFEDLIDETVTEEGTKKAP